MTAWGQLFDSTPVGSHGEIPLIAKCAMSGAPDTPLSQTEGDEYHLAATAPRDNMMARVRSFAPRGGRMRPPLRRPE